MQLEKFRHSPKGAQNRPLKNTASLLAQASRLTAKGGILAWRERIIVDYFNTVPLAAAPSYGEIHGLGEGLFAWFGMQLTDVVSALKAPGLTPAKVRAFKLPWHCLFQCAHQPFSG